jgi:dTDP-glucose 4,6-dehydratase
VWDFWNVAKYVVIGSNAFSGQDFVDLLLTETDGTVIGVSRSAEYPAFRLRYRARGDLRRYRFIKADMNSDMDGLLAMLDAERPDYVVNFAAQSEVGPSWEHPEHWFATNTVALATLVNHLRKRDWLKRYLHISSPEAYGNCVGAVTEATPDNPSTPYAASKSAADMLIAVYQKTYGFPAMFIRATNVYGARQQLFKIMPRTVIYRKLGRKISLDGGGTAVKSFINVRDVSRGELAVLHAGDIGERYHLSPDGGIAVRDVVRAICERMGERFEDCVEIGPERPGQDAAYVIDSTKARQKFGWRPTIDFQQGVAELVDWVEQNWNDIQQQPLEYQHRA